MENQTDVDNQNAQQTGQNPVSQPIQISEKPKVNYWMISTIVLSLLLIGVIGIFVWKLQSQEKDRESLAPASTKSLVNLTPTASSNLTISPPPTNSDTNWKSFHFLCTACNGYPNYTIQYPADWIIQEKIEGGVGSIDLTKSGYKIFIQEPWAGYDRCLYSDSKPFEGPSVKFGSFVEIKTSDDGVLRRPQLASQGKELTLCGRSAEGDFYTVSKYGTIKYKLPNNVDQPTLSIMDKIIGTLKLDSQ